MRLKHRRRAFNNIVVRETICSHLSSKAHLVGWRCSPPHQFDWNCGEYQANEGLTHRQSHLRRAARAGLKEWHLHHTDFFSPMCFGYIYFSFAALGSLMVGFLVGEVADLRHSCEHRRTLTINEGGRERANRPNTAGHDGTPATLSH